MDDYDSDDDYNYGYYDYNGDEFFFQRYGDDDLSNDSQDDGYDDVRDVENLKLPSEFCDYHPSWKKSKKTFLDLYFVAERTKQLIDFTREHLIDDDDANESYENVWKEELETSYENVLKHLAVCKKRSIAILSNVLGLPDLVIEKIFIYIVESYNWDLDKFGPEEMPWRYEEAEEDDPDGTCEDDDNNPEVYYNIISDIYEKILIGQIPSKMQELGFDLSGLGTSLDGLEISDSGSGDD